MFVTSKYVANEFVTVEKLRSNGEPLRGIG